MEIIYITIPLVLVVGALVVAVFILMAKSGQFDDMDGAAHRMLMEEDVSAEAQEAAGGKKVVMPNEAKKDVES